MEILEQQLNKKLNSKYSYLKLFEVDYERVNKTCVITFLFPFTYEEPNEDEKQEIENTLKEILNLFAKIKVKYKKSFLDDFLVNKEILNFFEVNHKLIYSCLSEENIKTNNQDFDVNIKLEVNSSTLKYFNENQIQTKLINFLNTKFIGNFFVEFEENNEILKTVDIDIEFPIQKLAKTVRYEVVPLKKVIGDEIVPKPEFMANVKTPKLSVIFAGVIQNIIKKEFIRKKGKRQGQTGIYFTFTLREEKSSIECLYFCPKTKEKVMDSIENGMYFLCVGDVKTGLNGKLTYYVNKMTLAYPKDYQEEEEEEETVLDLKPVVEIEQIMELEQENLFLGNKEYNEKISENDIVVFDLETTGLDPDSSEITEIGAVKIKKGVIAEKFSTFCKIKEEIPEEVVKLTGITDEMLKDAPPVENVINDFYNFTRDCIISGHNVIGFDIKFIYREGKKLGLNFENQIIDTLTEARTSGYKFGNFKLGTIAKELGISLVGAHRAWNDAFATAKVLLKLNEIK